MAGFRDSSLEHCLLELLLNSLSSEATAIAVRIDVHKQRIQVIDNGYGISKNALRYIGEYREKNRISKNVESREENVSIFGKSLINMRGFSSVLIIMSRRRNSSDTYGKFFIDGKIPEIKRIDNRPSCGTTVTLYDSINVCEWNCKIDSFAIRYIIIYLALVNTQVSFSVRDDARQSILLGIGKNQKSRQLLRIVCERSLTSGQVCRVKTLILERIKIEIFWGMECTDSRKIQQIFLNLRPVNCPLIENFMIKIVKKLNKKRTNLSLEKIFFLLYVRAPETEYEFSMKNDRLIVEFHEIDRILRCIRNIVTKSNSNGLKSSTLSNYKPIIPPLIFRPTGRILGLKRKRTFLTKVSKQNFENRSYRNETKVKEERVRPVTEKFNISENAEFPTINNETDHTVSVVKHKSPETIMTVKQDNYYDILDVSQISQRCIEKSVKVPGTSKTISENENRTENLSIRNEIYNNYDTSWITQKCVEKSQKDADTFSTASRNQNRDKNLSIRSRNYDNNNISWISQKCIEKSRKGSCVSETYIEKSPNGIEEPFDINELSQWSNWSYHAEMRNEKKTCESARPIIYQRFRFLPVHLHALLPRGNVKLISRDPLDNDKVTMNFNFNNRRRDLEVRPCTRRPREFRLKLQSLKSMKVIYKKTSFEQDHKFKVLKQVNNEFIVALTRQDDTKLLVIIDQHAMHERIRYENLLSVYKRNEKNEQFVSVVLQRPIIITDFSARACNFLSNNRKLLLQYGLSFSHENEHTLLISAAPRCFLKKTFYNDNALLEIAVRKLLEEILEDLANDGFKKILPFTIHEAIASEACHGSIKFGDPLTPDQCDILVSSWKDTDAPNRCAHGRPSVVPLLELSSYERNQDNPTSKEKLNFGSLLKSRAYVHYQRNVKKTGWTGFY